MFRLKNSQYFCVSQERGSVKTNRDRSHLTKPSLGRLLLRFINNVTFTMNFEKGIGTSC